MLGGLLFVCMCGMFHAHILGALHMLGKFLMYMSVSLHIHVLSAFLMLGVCIVCLRVRVSSYVRFSLMCVIE